MATPSRTKKSNVDSVAYLLRVTRESVIGNEVTTKS